jgi:hypothetical protein
LPFSHLNVGYASSTGQILSFPGSMHFYSQMLGTTYIVLTL